MWWGWATSRLLVAKISDFVQACAVNLRPDQTLQLQIGTPGVSQGAEWGGGVYNVKAWKKSWSQDVCSSTLSHRQDDDKLWTQKSLNSNLRKSWLDNVLCRSLHLGDQTSWSVFHGYTGPVASLIITRCMPGNNILYLLICISSGQTYMVTSVKL